MQPMYSLSTLNRTLNFALWRGLEIIVRWVVLSRGERAAMREERSRSFNVLTVEASGLRMGALGHGCMDSEQTLLAGEAFDPSAKPAIVEACMESSARERRRRKP